MSSKFKQEKSKSNSGMINHYWIEDFSIIQPIKLWIFHRGASMERCAFLLFKRQIKLKYHFPFNLHSEKVRDSIDFAYVLYILTKFYRCQKTQTIWSWAVPSSGPAGASYASCNKNEIEVLLFTNCRSHSIKKKWFGLPVDLILRFSSISSIY